MRFSPWGHPVRKLAREISGLATMKSDFRLRSFQAEWGFLARDKRQHERLYLTEFKGQMDFAGKEYVPQKNDPFVFTSKPAYDSLLDRINKLSSKLDAVVDKWHAHDLSDADSIKRYANHRSVDRDALNFLSAEADILRKFTIQRLARPFWYVDGFAASNVEIQPLQQKVLDALIQYMVNTISKAKAKGQSPINIEDMADPLDTNAGAPSYASGPAAKLNMAHQFKAIYSQAWTSEQSVKLDEMSPLTLPTNVARTVAKISAAYHLPPSVVFSVGANRRFGPNRKWQPLYVPTGNDVVAASEVQNLPRMRNVYMAPYIYNVGLSPMVATMKFVRKKTHGWWHDDEMMKAKMSNLNQRFSQSPSDTYVLESDFSGFDRSISLRHRLVMLQSIAKAFPQLIPPATLDLASQHANLSYIIPDFTDISSNRAALECIPLKPVGLYSGLKLTSEIGSYIAMWATLTLLIVIKAITFDDIVNGNWNNAKLFYENQGDDGKFTITGKTLMMDVASHAERVYATFGLKVTFAIGSRFLMRHYMKGANYPVIARILQQTISNEHVKESSAIYTLGFLARTMGYVNLKKALNDITNKCDPELTKIIRDYVTEFEDIISSLALNPILAKSLLKDDAMKLSAIAQLSLELPTATVDGNMSLLSLIEAERFSATGRELLAALSSTNAQALLDAKAHKEAELFKMTCNLTQLTLKY